MITSLPPTSDFQNIRTENYTLIWSGLKRYISGVIKYLNKIAMYMVISLAIVTLPP